jgi:NTP pyrophosphatase (non-canonical NTP hydrolase)
MKPSDYINNALRTESNKYKIKTSKKLARIEHAAMGLVTESGEITDALKRHKFYGFKLDYANLIEEAGDVMWYLAVLCDGLGVSFEEVWDKNIRKLRARYPKKYTHLHAKHRNLEKERQELEH